MKHIAQGLRLPCQKAKTPGAGTAKGLLEAKLTNHFQYRRCRDGCKALLGRLMKLLIVRAAMREWLSAPKATWLIQKLGVAHA